MYMQVLKDNISRSSDYWGRNSKMYKVLSTILKDGWKGDGKLVLQLLEECDQQGFA